MDVREAPAPAPEVRVRPLPPAAPEERPRWSLATRLGFRFALVFLLLHMLPFPLPQLATLLSGRSENEFDGGPPSELQRWVKDWVSDPYEKGMDRAVLWTGEQVFGVEITYRPFGSGDTTFNYVQEFLFLVVAGAAALVWSLAAWVRRRLTGREPAYSRLHEAFRVYVRSYLAYTMFVYGLAKVIKLQFPYPDTENLLGSYGESSPMHLLWTFMGASESYTIFAGAGEVLGGLLLCTRRTTLLGSLVTFGVMSHVVALNFSYDVPVKLFSTFLVLLALFLMAPDLPWLGRVFVLGQRALPRPATALTRWKWLNGAGVVLRTALVVAFLYLNARGTLEMRRTVGDLAPQPPLYGLWDVEEFALDGVLRPPLTDDVQRWQRVTFTAKNYRGPWVVITPMKGPQRMFAVDVDEASRTVTLSNAGPKGGRGAPIGRLHYQEPAEGVLVLEGQLGVPGKGKVEKQQVRVRLRHMPEEGFLLNSRGFHWINEVPYNRSAPRGTPPPGLPPPPKRP
jgi:uncharacterized membrane protein YphA (DoxX/SURF4 family)